MTGYIKMYRKIKYSPIYHQPPLYLRVFERLIIEANHKCCRVPYDGETKLVKRGERLTSIRQIADWVGWYERGIFKSPNPKTIKKIIDWLEEEGMIEIVDKGNRKVTHYKVRNYSEYQSMNDVKSNSKYTVSTQYVGINNNVKNEKKELKDTMPFSEVVNFLNQQTGKNYKVSSKKTKDLIRARFNEGFTLEDFKTVITKKSKQWKDTDMDKYLRPETLFSSKFEGYLNEKEQPGKSRWTESQVVE